MSFISSYGLQMQMLDQTLEKREASWDQYDVYMECIAGMNISGERFWDNLAKIKKDLIVKDPDDYLQHELTYGVKTWPHLDTSYHIDSIFAEIVAAYE